MRTELNWFLGRNFEVVNDESPKILYLNISIKNIWKCSENADTQDLLLFCLCVFVPTQVEISELFWQPSLRLFPEQWYLFPYAAIKPVSDFLLQVGCGGGKSSVLIADVSISFLVALPANPEVELIHV